jgi:hypothetical protein
MYMNRVAVACTLAALTSGACSAGPAHGGHSVGSSSNAAPTANSSSAATTKSPAGTLVIVADPCVGVGFSPATHYYPVPVSVRKGSSVVFQATIAGGREHRLLLPAGSYVISASYGGAVQATLMAGATASAHLVNGCK